MSSPPCITGRAAAIASLISSFVTTVAASSKADSAMPQASFALGRPSSWLIRSMMVCGVRRPGNSRRQRTSA